MIDTITLSFCKTKIGVSVMTNLNIYRWQVSLILGVEIVEQVSFTAWISRIISLNELI